MCGPGHGGRPFWQRLLRRTYSEFILKLAAEVKKGLQKFVQGNFLFPAARPVSCQRRKPQVSIPEGGELGYVISHSYGAVLEHSA